MEGNKELYRAMLIFFFSIIIIAQAISAQIFPDELKIPVTYFDFHSNGDCPDFNPVNSNDPPIKNMVKNNLDSDNLPEVGSKIFFNYYVENWFRNSENGEQSITDKKPVYTLYTGDFQSETTVSTNPYENIEIEDTLIFKHIGDDSTYPLGTYQYTNDKFFPLDDKGFGKEPTTNWNGFGPLNDHNYSFTMVLKKEFVFRENMKFEFLGDDDVWVFINNKLALDIGGIHMKALGKFDLDSLSDQLELTLGEKYNFSFFYAERQANESHIKITTNIISAPPESLSITVQPNDTIYIGDTLIASDVIETDTGAVSISQLPGNLIWGFLDPLGINKDTTFKSTLEMATFIPTDAYTTIYIWAIYTDTASDILLKDTVQIVVLPGPPDHIVIEDSPQMPTDKSLWNDNPLDTIYIFGGQLENEKFYGILRDKNGNWIGPAQNLDWSSADKNIVTAKNGSNPELGQGKAIRETSLEYANTNVITECDTNGLLLSDDIKVMIVSTVFIVKSVAYFDTDKRPDGYIDLIKVIMDDNLILSNEMFEILFNSITLPDGRYFVYDKNDFNLTNSGFSIKVSQTKSKVGNPNTAVDNNDKIKFTLTEIPNVGVILPTDLDIKDSLAPVIYKGILYPAINKPDNDTLHVYFSEKIKPTDKNSPFLFLCNSGDTTYDMKLKLITDNNDDLFKFVVLSKTKEYPENNDSLWIESDGEIVDTKGIKQKKDTKPAHLEVKVHKYRIKKAYYTDKDGDGGIDHVELKLYGQPRELPKKIIFNSPFPGVEKKTVSGDEITWLDNDPSKLTIIVTFKNPFDYHIVSNDEGYTYFKTEKFGRIDSKPHYSPKHFDIYDKVAVVIHKAVFCPGKILDLKNELRATDTLIISFSERVDAVSYPNPFKLINIKKKKYYFRVNQYFSSNKDFIFLVDKIIDTNYPVKGDSIWIDRSADITDKWDNKQNNKNNRRVKLLIKKKPFDPKISILNPIDPDKNKIDNLLVNNNFQSPIENGTFIIIDPMINFSDAELKKVTFRIVIYDAVGNIVAKSRKLNEYSNKYIQSFFTDLNSVNQLVVLWTGQNSMGRDVGAGTYLCDMKIAKPESKPYSGMRRQYFRFIYVVRETRD